MPLLSQLAGTTEPTFLLIEDFSVNASSLVFGLPPRKTKNPGTIIITAATTNKKRELCVLRRRRRLGR